jgi:hypothetical protein
MWVIALGCDGCREWLRLSEASRQERQKQEDRISAYLALPEGLPKDVRWTLADLDAHKLGMRRDAREKGWERVESPDDGEEWYCPACRRARDGQALAKVTA